MDIIVSEDGHQNIVDEWGGLALVHDIEKEGKLRRENDEMAYLIFFPCFEK